MLSFEITSPLAICVMSNQITSAASDEGEYEFPTLHVTAVWAPICRATGDQALQCRKEMPRARTQVNFKRPFLPNCLPMWHVGVID